MKVLWIFAHPERCSLNGALLDEGLDELSALGHPVQVSDLYRMGWDPVVDTADMSPDTAADPAGSPGARRDPGRPDAARSSGRFFVGAAQQRAYTEGALSPDIRAEQQKLTWADAVITQFPLWWLGPPAILKGWFDRVLVQGFAFGVRDDWGRTLRYGSGGLQGKRALAVTSIGARSASFGPRGIHGPLEEVLFPLLHGTFWYTGMYPLPPHPVYGADRMTEGEYREQAKLLRERLRTLPTADPIPYRYELGGDYTEDLTVRPELTPNRTGLAVHRSD